MWESQGYKVLRQTKYLIHWLKLKNQELVVPSFYLTI